MSDIESVLVFSRLEPAHQVMGSSGLLFGSGSCKLCIPTCKNLTYFGRGWMGEGECEVDSVNIWLLINSTLFGGEVIS